MPDDEMEDMRKRLASLERTTSQLRQVVGSQQQTISYIYRSIEDLKAERLNEQRPPPVRAPQHDVGLPLDSQNNSSLQAHAQSHPPPETLEKTAFIRKICPCNLAGDDCALEACAKDRHCFTLGCTDCILTHGQVIFSDLTCGHYLRNARQHAQKYGALPETSCKRGQDLSTLCRQIHDAHDRDCPLINSRKKMGLPSHRESRRGWVRRNNG